MKEWPLTQGKVALVDDDVFVRLLAAGKHWQAVERVQVWYAAASFWVGGVRTRPYMHRWITGAPADLVVDHINGDGLDNRRENLRAVARRENAQNLHAVHGEVAFRGVAKSQHLYRAYGFDGDKQLHHGCFSTAEAAAVVRDHRERARGRTHGLNFDGNAPMSLKEALTQQHALPKSKTGHKGIRVKDGKYEAWTRIEGRRVYLGRFPTLARALKAQSASR